VYLKGVAGRVRGIYVTAAEMMTKEGRRKAKEQFIAATEWAERKGARVVLLAASTKRLFGRDGAELKARFPNILFTIGDNGTAQLLQTDVFRALEMARLRPNAARVLVIGPYGILGQHVTQALIDEGYEVVGYGSNQAALAELALRYPNMQVMTEIRQVGMVDAVVACTHSTESKLSAECVEWLRHHRRKLLVVDVAEPANLDQDTYALCRDVVVRQDAGNAFSQSLEYVLGSFSSNLLMLSDQVVFGCFAEAMTLYHAIYLRGHGQLAERDWFVVNSAQITEIAMAFAEIGFRVSLPNCFGEPVKQFSLLLNQRPDLAPRSMRLREAGQA
jgi:predicted amino acid dehydrogenase